MLTMTFYGSKADVVAFVNVQLYHFENDYASITIINPGRSEGFYVSVVTDISSAGIVEKRAQSYLLARMHT